MRRWLVAFVVLSCLRLASAETTPVVPNQTSFQGYAEAPPFEVVPRQEQLKFYPCSQCHRFMEPNPKPRKLTAPHSGELQHGKGRLWCTNCHYSDDRDYLTTAIGEPVDFDRSHLVCGSCHANRHRDWYFGGHGKRVANWQGVRRLYNCVHCHAPHEPTIAPRKPMAPPPVRIGLTRQEAVKHERRPIWDRSSVQH